MTIISRSRRARGRIAKMQAELRRLPSTSPEQNERGRSIMRAHRNVIFARGAR
jgi:hypothetical protein